MCLALWPFLVSHLATENPPYVEPFAFCISFSGKSPVSFKGSTDSAHRAWATPLMSAVYTVPPMLKRVAVWQGVGHWGPLRILPATVFRAQGLCPICGDGNDAGHHSPMSVLHIAHVFGQILQMRNLWFREVGGLSKVAQ